MARQTHSSWYETVKSSRERLRNEPTNVELADHVWNLISGSSGYDVRSGRRAVEIYRASAFHSHQGLTSFVAAFRALVDDTGEHPQAILIDPPLHAHLVRSFRIAEGELRDHLHWLLEAIESDAY